MTIPDGWIEAATALEDVRTYRIEEGDEEWPGMNVAVENDDGVHHVHAGRAAVISFDSRSVWARRISDETIAEILESFEFAD